MRLYTLEDSPEIPVSHNPELKKRVLVEGGVSSVRHISHIALKPGDTADPHSHKDATEVFYCIKGEISLKINGTETRLKQGSCLLVEPGEVHEIFKVTVDSEMLYMMVE